MVRRIYSDYFLIIISWIISVFVLKIILCDYYFPFCLLLGPLLYEAHLQSISKNSNQIFLKISAILFAGLLFFRLLLVFNGHVIDSQLNALLTLLKNVFSIISLSFFSIMIFFNYKKQPNYYSNKEVLTIQVAVIYSIAAISKSILILNTYSNLKFDFPLAKINFILIFFVLFICIYHLVREMQSPEAAEMEDSIGVHNPISYEEELYFKKQLENIVKENQIHLRVDFSLDMLAKHTGIPKYRWSQYFSQLHMSFYEYFALYKIYHALYNSVCSSDDRLTVAAMANESGFSSVTTFSKYFKEYVGCSPAEWREKKLQL